MTIKVGHMQTMAAGEFKAKCLAVMDEVQAKRTPVTITKHGKPVARLVPVEEEKDSIFGFLKGKVKIKGEIDVPSIPAEAWKRFK